MRILIAETGQHVLEAARYYARDDHTVILALEESVKNRPKFFYSRYISHIINYSSHVNDYFKIKELKKIYDREKIDIFFPFGFDLVTNYINAISIDENFKMNTPYQTGIGYWKLSDKDVLYQTVSKTDVRIPKRYGSIKGGIVDLNVKDTNYPLILKRTRGVGIKNNVRLVWDKAEIDSFVSELSDPNQHSGEFLIQEYIPGDVFDVGGFAIEGDIFYAVPQRRTVTLPLRGGVAAVNDIFPDETLISLASEIIKKSGWTGPFQAEFRWNPRDRSYYLIEVNAKMWGSIPLSLLSNPDILDIAVCVALGKKSEKSLDFKNDIRYRWICSQEILAISKGDKEDFYEFIKRFFKKSEYDFSFSDPLPHLIRFLSSLYLIIFRKDTIADALVSREEHMSLNDLNK